MRYWRTTQFWFAYVVLVIPSQLVFSAPGAILIHEGTGAIKGIGILLSENVLGLLVPWLMAREVANFYARRKARIEQNQRGFPVIQRES
jgi:hypothetical protein